MKKKVVVFGGSGFLGSHVADALTDSGHDVAIFDLHRSLYLSETQEMICGDILDKEAVEKACRDCDVVYNFAGLADINEAKEAPYKTANLNIMGNLNILEAASKNQVKRFVFASTVYVYSESGSFYRASKQACEKFIEIYYERYNLPFTILRYGSLYGKRSDHRNAIHNFIVSALTNGTIQYTGSGEELREYIHVEDAATASVMALQPEFENQHITITGHQTFRVKDVMMMISEILQGNVELKFAQEKLEAHYSITPYSYKPRLGKKLVVNPFVDMGQGILDCIHEIDGALRFDKDQPRQ
jgi:UDP-glucose 4-epimerase